MSVLKCLSRDIVSKSSLSSYFTIDFLNLSVFAFENFSLKSFVFLSGLIDFDLWISVVKNENLLTGADFCDPKSGERSC